MNGHQPDKKLLTKSLSMDYSVIDIETDGLLENVTKIHCMSIKRYRNGDSEMFSLINYDQMIDFIYSELALVGHNLIRYDAPVLEKILGVKITARLIDTLALSWYCYPNRQSHNLEDWGEDLGVPKPVILDWNNLSVEEYIFRCESDVEITDRLLNNQIALLFNLYGNGDDVARLVNYLSFKMDCAREQEAIRWKLDKERCLRELAELEQEKEKRVRILTAAMPNNIKYKPCSRPKNCFKKDGTHSEAGKRWFALLESMSLPDYTVGPIKVIDCEEPGNPNSHVQVKNWLYSLGWEPISFEYRKNKKTGEVKKVPQVSNDEGDICESVRDLFSKAPGLEALEGVSVISHRIGILKGFLEKVSEDGFLKAEIQGFTNTLRFQHAKPIVNLPTLQKEYGDLIRGCLIAPDDDHELCGSDMSGLEEATKHHYMYFYDPEYVKEIRKPGYDPHLDIALEANLVTVDDIFFYKSYDKEVATVEEKERYSKIKDERNNKAKKVNFGAVYGAGPPKIAQTGRFSLDLAKVLFNAYWKKNWSVKKVANNTKTKKVGGQMWLFNPVSQFWYSLRAEKDKFSTLNQSTGVYCFDTQVRNVRKQGIRMCGQFHDEFIFPLLKGKREEATEKLNKAIEWTNQELKLNITLGISIEFGPNYADIH